MDLLAENSVILRDIQCVRGERTLFDGLNLELGPGAGLLVQGPNGSGKTSLLRVIAGYLPPQAGTIEVKGGAEDAAATQLHFLGHKDGLKPPLTVRDQLAFWGLMLGGPESKDKSVITSALSHWGLAGLADLPCGVLSAGQARRLALARLLVAERPIWLLDEPTAPLDEHGLAVFEQTIAGHRAKGGIAIVATHRSITMPDAQVLALGERAA